MQTIRSNAFDDDLIEKCLSSLQKAWKTHPMSKNFVQAEYGHVDVVLSCLKNQESAVLINACLALNSLLEHQTYTSSLIKQHMYRKTESQESLVDMVIRHRGVHLLKQVAQDSRIEIKKVALRVLGGLSAVPSVSLKS